ncbi:MAG: ACT domain-containing protein [Gammaproteobacteria bacterium]|nr:ACT domain-containing protein [Gammaproteobacteria bacterium]
MPKQTLQLLNDQFTIHSFAYNDEIPSQVLRAPIFFIGKTFEELSIVCPSDITVDSLEHEAGWMALEVLGPLAFSLTGIMSQISGVLADAGISIFAISTFDTDYILVKEEVVTKAVEALRKNDYKVVTS